VVGSRSIAGQTGESYVSILSIAFGLKAYSLSRMQSRRMPFLGFCNLMLSHGKLK
jgi:hypothetical protein